MLFKMRLFARAPPANNQRQNFYIILKLIYIALFWAVTKKSTIILVESNQNLEINKIQVARHIFTWEPGVLNMAPHKNMPAYKKNQPFSLHIERIYAIYLFPVGFGNPIECHISNPLTYSHTYPIPSIPTPYLPKTILTYPIPNLRICQGALVSVIPPELKNKHRERSFFLAKECKSRVKFISVVDKKLPVRCFLFTGTVLVRCFLFTGTVPVNNLFLFGK